MRTLALILAFLAAPAVPVADVTGTMTALTSVHTKIVSSGMTIDMDYVSPNSVYASISPSNIDVKIIDNVAWMRTHTPAGAWMAMTPTVVDQLGPLRTLESAYRAGGLMFSLGKATYQGRPAHRYQIYLGYGYFTVVETDADHYWHSATYGADLKSTVAEYSFSQFNSVKGKISKPAVAGTPFTL